MLWHWNVMFGISIHAPLRERPNNPTMLGKRFTISIHALSRERLKTIQHSAVLSVISIHAPLRERPPPWNKQVVGIYISIHAPLRERRLGQESLNKRPFISIHAPLRERPGMVWFIQAKQGHFNPRSLAGATIGGSDIACIMGLFQSTLPYGSDISLIRLINSIKISIHAPLRERQNAGGKTCTLTIISIHAPLRKRRGT